MIEFKSSSCRVCICLRPKASNCRVRSAARREAFWISSTLRRNGCCGRQRVQHQLGVGTDDHQKIVEIVGHSSGQSADGVHFLRLLKLIFQPAPVRNVPVIGDKMRDLSFAVPQGSDGFLRHENLSVLLAVDHGAAKDVARENGLPQLLVEFRSLLAGLQNSRGLAHQFPGGVTGQRLESRVHILDHSLAVGNHDQVRRLLDRAPKFAKRVLRLLALPFLAVDVDGVRMVRVREGSSGLRLDETRRFRISGPCRRRLHPCGRSEISPARREPSCAHLMQQAQCSAISRFVLAQQQVVGRLAQSHQRFFGRERVVEPQIPLPHSGSKDRADSRNPRCLPPARAASAIADCGLSCSACLPCHCSCLLHRRRAGSDTARTSVVTKRRRNYRADWEPCRFRNGPTDMVIRVDHRAAGNKNVNTGSRSGSLD